MINCRECGEGTLYLVRQHVVGVMPSLSIDLDCEHAPLVRLKSNGVVNDIGRGTAVTIAGQTLLKVEMLMPSS